MAPLAIFSTELLELTKDENGRKGRVRYMSKNQGDPEDPHDNMYLEATSRKYTKAGDVAAGENIESSQQNLDPDEIGISVTNENSNSTSDRIFSTSAAGDLYDYAHSAYQPEQLLTLDTAILRSIDSCPSEDARRKMYSSILLVGGGVKFRGVAKYLKHKLTLQVSKI